ncbi:MAG TPA: hypothetical protein VKW04_00570 [Planctomycetota bacterium]|nr:hypothetical protein [Planctomycetota bacterium]
MQSRWTYVATGMMTGIIGVLLTLLIAQNREPQAWAAPQSVDNTHDGLIMGSGGATTNTQDVLWVLYKRPAPAGSGAKDSILSKAERVTLCCYQVANGARNMKLVAVRDISFDIDLVEYGNDKPHVKEIVDELKKAEKK